MQVEVIFDGAGAVIRLDGRFDSKAQCAFRDAIDVALKGAGMNRVCVDFRDVDFIDSTALGMLLVLREQARARGMDVSLANCRGAVKSVIDIANFSKIFGIS